MKQIIDRVLEYSKNNPNGFTLNIETFKPIKFGICVAFLETQNCFGTAGLELAISHALKHQKIIGGWLNEENKLYYFDSVKVFKQLKPAIEFAKQNKQIAIFDLTNFIQIEIT